MFDTHCHLNFEVYKDSVAEVVARAQVAGVDCVVVVGTTLENSRRALELSRLYSGVYAAVGVHPHKAVVYLGRPLAEVLVEVRRELENLIGEKGVVAVGEIGFDRYHYPKTTHSNYRVTKEFIELQRRLFGLQLEIALEYQKPIIIHNRQASSELLAELNTFFTRHPGSAKQLQGKVVFHCCEPDNELLTYALAHQWFIGVAGDVTLNAVKQEWVRHIPLKNLVLETDAPFFKPVVAQRDDHLLTHQRKNGISEPSDLLKIGQTIAKFQQKTLKTVDEYTTHNAHRLFGV